MQQLFGSALRAVTALAAFWLFAIALLVTGCSSPPAAALPDAGPGDAGPSDAGPDACAPGELTRDDGTCQPAGLPPDLPCPPGEWLLDGGACQKAGVPPEACAVGFLPDGKDGCAPVLPADPCPVGQMAVPGDTACHEVAPCGSGTWGDIPVEASTQFVDQAYQGGSNDGTQARPWTTIQQGLDAAAKGAIVAVAAGSYGENILIDGDAVRLWGRCPALVEVVGTGVVNWTVQVIKSAAKGTEIHGVAVTGPIVGVGVSGASGVVLEGVWIHDTGNGGLEALDELGPTSVALKGSLVEHCYGEGVVVVGVEATIEGSVVRSTLPDGQGTVGHGVEARDDTVTKKRANMTVKASLVEQNTEAGVLVTGSDASIEGSVIRSTSSNAKGHAGRGLDIESDPFTKARANVIVHGCLVEQSHEVGVFVGSSDATIEDTVVRDTLPVADGTGGTGIQIDVQKEGRAGVTVRACLVEQNHQAGVFVAGSDATIEATVVRLNLPDAQGTNGLGIAIQDDLATKARANVTVHGCLVEQNHEAGVFVSGADATIEGTVVRLNLPDAQEKFGRGINVQDDVATAARASVIIRACLVEQNHEAGVFIANSDAIVEATVVRGTVADTEGTAGGGLFIETDPLTNARAKVTVHACLVEQNQDASVVVLSSDATIEDTVVRETTSQSDGRFGDGVFAEKSAVAIKNVESTHNARAGVSNFGGQVVITGGTFTCNGFDLEGEPKDALPFSFDGSTGWRCSRRVPAACTVLDDCHVETNGIEAPSMLPGVGPLP